MSKRRQPLRAVLIGAMSAAVLATTLVTWVATVPGNSAHDDFAPYYASALLVREGHAAAMYDLRAQSDVLRNATGGVPPSRVATALTPPAVLADVPLTVLPLRIASLVWSGLQALLLVAAAVIAVRAAPWAARSRRSSRALLTAAALAGGGTLMLLPLNQWDGVAAVGLALTYADLRGGRDQRAMVWLTLLVLAGKPHLAIGMALFLVARHPRSALTCAAAAAPLAALTLLVVPTSAIGQWLATLVHVNGAFPASSSIGVSGLVASLFGDGVAATTLGYTMAGGALLGCVALGRWAGRRRRADRVDQARVSIDPLFAGATLLSLLAAPHIFPYDLVLLIPGFIGFVVWGIAAEAASPWPGRMSFGAVGVWFVAALLTSEMVLPPGSYRPTALLPLLLLLSAAACVLAAARRPRSWVTGTVPRAA